MREILWSSDIEELSCFHRKPSKEIKILKKLGYKILSDLLWILPNKYQVIPPPKLLQTAKVGDHIQSWGKILNIQIRSAKNSINFKRGPKLQNLTVWIENNETTIALTWFNTYPSFIQKIKKLDSLHFSGEVSQYQNTLQIINPFLSENSIPLYPQGKIVPIYPTVNGIKPERIAKYINSLPWDNLTELESCLDEKYISLEPPISLGVAFCYLHSQSFIDCDQNNFLKKIEFAKKRIKYEEACQIQIKFLNLKKHNQMEKAPTISNNLSIVDFLGYFPYLLTPGQKTVIETIQDDFKKPFPMKRLIQGDVGCGKTTVALLAALLVIKSGHQVAFMCPTEALAQQHFLNFVEILKNSNIKIDLLCGRIKAKEKNRLISSIKNGEIKLLLGTHSLIQDNVSFNSLGLIIIDEQHRFGVEQREKLLKKGSSPHCLFMSATPIPRTLELTQFGDLNISTIHDLPQNRKSVSTRIILPNMWLKFLNFVKTRLEMGEQAYVVVPAIEDNPELDFLALEEITHKFLQLFPNFEIKSLHGKMKGEHKNQILEDFKKRKFPLLISTSVIEVGIDVGNATIMAIFSPERFGLSSLHQLRGRVGRGGLPGFCFLVTDKILPEAVMARLAIIEKNTNGFIIAQEDLKMRGPGNILGFNQSGHNGIYKFLSPIDDYPIIEMAQKDISTNVETKSGKIFQSLPSLGTMT